MGCKSVLMDNEKFLLTSELAKGKSMLDNYWQVPVQKYIEDLE